MSPVASPAAARPARFPRLAARLRPRRGPSRPALMVAGVLLAVVATGCSVIPTASPQPTPADFPGIVTQLAKRGIIVGNWVSGDAGCTDRTLVPTSIAFNASGLDQPKVTRVHIYIFRNADAFERLRASVDDCARSFVTDPQGYENLAESPFVVAAQGPWGPKFEAAMREALTVAAGTGG